MQTQNIGERISGYCIRQINGYEIHTWAIGGPAIHGIYGLWPHHNPKIGNSYTVEPCSSEDVASISRGDFDKEQFSQSIIRRHRESWPQLWAEHKE